MPDARYLIVNADDFGQSAGVNQGIARAHEHGIVTSASLMVRWPAAPEAAAYARAHPALGMGLHVDLGEWALHDGRWEPVYEVVPLHDPVAVREEVARQLLVFRRLTGAAPTHVDSHQHVHRHEPARTVLRDLAGTLGVPLRHDAPAVRYCGAFYGQAPDGTSLPEAVGPDALIRLVAALPAGVTELACHPALGDDLDTMYHRERAREAASLCAPGVKAALARHGIVLCSFRDVPLAVS